MKWQKLRAPLRVVLAVFFIGAGALHFLRPEPYLKIMPPYLPWHLGLVYLSGLFEIAGGAAVLVRPLRRAAGAGLIALLVAVFPANVQMFLDALAERGWSAFTVAALVRLPLQVPLILWVYWCTRE